MKMKINNFLAAPLLVSSFDANNLRGFYRAD
jgi:hypothetical protein